jgi:hypothetical protein
VTSKFAETALHSIVSYDQDPFQSRQVWHGGECWRDDGPHPPREVRREESGESTIRGGVGGAWKGRAANYDELHPLRRVPGCTQGLL